jgi:hypothetical protein
VLGIFKIGSGELFAWAGLKLQSSGSLPQRSPLAIFSLLVAILGHVTYNWVISVDNSNQETLKRLQTNDFQTSF